MTQECMLLEGMRVREVLLEEVVTLDDMGRGSTLGQLDTKPIRML
jgi:hypothetical protein